MKKSIWRGMILMLAGVLLFPGVPWAAPQGKLVVGLSSDISTLDTQYHNIRVNYIVRVEPVR